MQNSPIVRPPVGQALQRLAIAVVLGVAIIIALAIWTPRFLGVSAILCPVLTLALVLPVIRKQVSPGQS